MGFINRLDTHTITVSRNSSTLLDAVPVVATNTLTNTFNIPIVVEFTIPSGTATFVVTGTLGGLTTSSTVVFSSGGTILKKSTDKSFDTLSSIVGTTGTAASMIAKTLGKTGQPIFRDSAVYTGIRCRIDNIGKGSAALLKGVAITPDTLCCYVGADYATEYSILVDDKVVEASTLDQSGRGAVSPHTYVVKNVDNYYNRSNFIYQELTLAKV